MDFRPFFDLLNSVHVVEIRTHENADADAVASALSLKFVLETLGKSVVATCPGSVSRIGSVLARSISEKIVVTETPSRADLLVYVDCKPAESSEHRLAVIDHHQGGLKVPVSFSAIDPDVSSSSELVFELIETGLCTGYLNSLPKRIGRLLISGIIADTGDLRLSKTKTLRSIIRISEVSRAEPFESFTLLKTPIDRSLKIACLKAASRMKIRTTRGYLIAITQVSSFQGDVASSLIHLGADIAFAAGKRKDILQASGRARMELVEIGLNLAHVMTKVGVQFQGNGGGHAGAAAMKGRGEPRDVLEACVTETKKMIREILPQSGSNLN